MQKNLYRYTHIYVKLSFARHQKLIQHCESTFTSIFKRRKKKNRSVLSCVCARSLQTFLTLCDPMDHSLPSSSVHGILQARILEWVPCPPPGDILNPGIKPMSLTSPVLADTEPPGRPNSFLVIVVQLPSCLLSYLSANHFKNLGRSLEFLKAH